MDAPGWNGAPGSRKYDRDDRDDPRETVSDPLDYCAACGAEIRNRFRSVLLPNKHVALVCNDVCHERLLLKRAVKSA